MSFADAEHVTRLRELIDAARRVVIFTGAGISTESGIPDFRSPGGLWTKYQPIDLRDPIRDGLDQQAVQRPELLAGVGDHAAEPPARRRTGSQGAVELEPEPREPGGGLRESAEAASNGDALLPDDEDKKLVAHGHVFQQHAPRGQRGADEYAKVLYGKGWALAVGVETGAEAEAGAPFTEGHAQSAFEAFLQSAPTRHLRHQDHQLDQALRGRRDLCDGRAEDRTRGHHRCNDR